MVAGAGVTDSCPLIGRGACGPGARALNPFRVCEVVSHPREHPAHILSRMIREDLAAVTAILGELHRHRLGQLLVWGTAAPSTWQL